jgi:hypothetical protein
VSDAEWQRRAKAETERQRSGKKRRGREHGLIAETLADKARTNFTDAELSVLPTANSGLGGPRPRAGERRWRVPDHPGEWREKRS